MELYPIYDENSKISKNIWYSISGIGESPFMRVGHTIIHSNTNNDNSKGKFYVIGGANPSNSFNDVYVLNMDTLSWDKFEDDLENFEKGRYEHGCLHDTQNNQVYIFGGCNEDGPLNSILKFDLADKKCSKVPNDSQNVPTPRTIHVAVSYKNQLVIFGGGSDGQNPILDQKLYIYNPVNNKWISLSLQGKVPLTRQGHLMINSNDSLIYLHGGMGNETIYDDLWVLDIKKMNWTELDHKKETNFPCARAAHGGISVNTNLYIFGGLDQTGCAFDDLWKYDSNTNQWSLIEIFGYKPPARIDFAYCKATFKIAKNQDNNEETKDKTDETAKTENNNSTESNSLSESNASNQQTYNDETFLIIHGGMDTEGNVFDDIFMINLE